MADIDNLTIQITAEANAAIDALTKLAGGLNAVNDALKAIRPSKLEKVATATESASKAASGLGETVKNINGLTDALNEAGIKTAKFGNATKNMSDYVRQVNEQTREASRSIREVGDSSASSGSGGFREMAKRVFDFGSALAGSSSYLKIMGGLVKGFFKGVTAPIQLASKAMRNFGKSSNFSTINAKKLFKELTRVGKMLKLMVTRMALRAVIKEVGNGFKSLALHSEQFNQSVSSMMNGAKKLGYSFAAMVSPLINALAPAIVYVINLLVKLLNAINQVFSALTGATTFNKSKDFAGSWADNIKAANKEAKQLKKTVLGFDELNQLQEKQTGGDTSGNITDMFDTEKIDPKWKKFADWLKKMWEMGDFTELGKTIGEKLRDFLESIPWEQIRKTANKLGGALATLINGFVEVERLGYDIGKTIAQSVNTVFEFLNGFVHKLHWDSIGKFIADTFNGFFENIDWALIKDTVITGMAGIAESLQTFINQFHWDNISDFIINGVDTIVSGIKTFVDGVDWEDLGIKIGDQLNKIMSGIDWKSVGETLGGVVEASIDWAYGLIETFNVTDAVNAIENFLKGVCEQIDSEKAGEALGTALHKLIEVIQKFWSNEENRNMIKEEIKDFFKGIFNSMTASDFDFIATSAAAAALLLGLRSIVGKGGLTVVVTLAVAYAGLKFGSWLGKILTGDKAYDEYTIPVIFELSITELENIKSFDDILDLIKEMRKAWWDMLYDADNALTAILKWINIIGNPRSWSEFLGRFADGKGWKGIDFGGAGGSGANAEADEWQKTIDAAKEATEKAKEYKTEAAPIWTASSGSGANVEATEWKNTVDAAKAATDAAKKSKDAISETTKTAKNYDATISGLNGKQRTLAGTITNTKDETNKLKDSSDKVTTSYGDQTTKAGSLNEALKNASTAYKNVKTGMEEPVKYAPVLDKAQQDIITSMGGVIDESGKLDETTATVWESFELNTENAEVSFAGTTKEIQKSMDETAGDIKKQNDDISKAFSKEKWTFKGVWEGLEDTFKKAKDKIKGIWNSIAEKLNGEHLFGSEKMKINLPKFAGGGFPENGLFLANSTELVGRFSNGKTAVANNEQIVQGISAGVYNAVSAAMANSNSNGGGYIANTIVVDGEVIARTVTKAQQRQQMRFSPQMG